MTRPPAPPIPLQADERDTLMAFLDFYRASLFDRAWGLDDVQLRTNLAPSPLTLGGLFSHMAMVELTWFEVRFRGNDMPAVIADLDFDADIDAEMTLSETMTGGELRDLLRSCIEISDQHVASAVSLDELTVGRNGDGEQWNLRWILVHMIEEYARHCGHADLIRESIDGDVCE